MPFFALRYPFVLEKDIDAERGDENIAVDETGHTSDTCREKISISFHAKLSL